MSTYNAGAPICQFGINAGVGWRECPSPASCQIHGPLMRQEQGAPGYGPPGSAPARASGGGALNLVLGLLSLAAVAVGVVAMLIVVSRPSNWLAALVARSPLAPAVGADLVAVGLRSALLFAISALPLYVPTLVLLLARRGLRDRIGAAAWVALSVLTAAALLALAGWLVVCVGVVKGLADGRTPYGPGTEPTAITPLVLGLLAGSVLWLAIMSGSRQRRRRAALTEAALLEE